MATTIFRYQVFIEPFPFWREQREGPREIVAHRALARNLDVRIYVGAGYAGLR